MTTSLSSRLPIEAAVEALSLCAAALALTLVATRRLIAWLRRHEFVKAIRVDGPDHGAKSGTPTMGGLAPVALVGVTGAYLFARYGAGLGVVLCAMAAFGLLGLLDDLAGLPKRSARRELGVGVTARRMLVAQFVFAAVVGLMLAAWSHGFAPPHILLTVLVVVGTVNGVNFSDGLDGLAAGLITIAMASLAVALIARDGALSPAATMALATAAACAGFLVYNRHPAQVFMGNVASYAFGAVLATLSLASGSWWLLPVIGAVFVLEVLSVLLQVGFYKLSGGRRVLRMAPIHHHYEVGGLDEVAVVRRFWLAGLAAGSAGIVLATRIQASPWPSGP